MTPARTLTPVRSKHRLTREEGGSSREQKPAGVQTAHATVMLKEAVEYLAPKKEEIVLDATGGGGGHSEALLTAADIRLVTIDADPEAVERIRARLKSFGARSTVVEANFQDLKTVLGKLSIERINKALFDLGWNRQQLNSGRGFSFLKDEPLSMSYGRVPASGFTAADIVNTWSEEAIADAIFGYGEERYARRIARAVIEARKIAPIRTTGELLELIAGAVPAAYRRGRTHFATRSFQALRIAVNDELGSLTRGLTAAWEMLAPQGRLAVISFHSIEDRAVKKLFREFADSGGTLVLKKPLVPVEKEIRENPSARSAKLRVIEKN